MIDLASRVSSAAPSATLAVAAKARERARKGLEVISFGTGEPDFDTPAHIRAAAAEALEKGLTRYPPVNGIEELREAVASELESLRGLSYSPSSVLVTVGAKQAIYNLCQAVLEPGSEAVIVSPYWVSYPEMVSLAGARPVVVHADFEEDFVPQVKRIAAAMNEGTRLLMLNSPSNPAGAVIPEATLFELADVLRKYPKVVVMTDDIYSKILFDDVRFSNLAMVAPDLRDRIVIADGVSKAYAMTGWRVGWAVGPDRLIKAMSIVQGQSTSGVTAFAQAGAIAALTGDQSVVDSMVEEFSLRRDRMTAMLNAIDGVSCRAPSGAFYAFPDVRKLMGRRYGDEELRTSGDMARILIEKQGLAVVDGAPFGAEGFIRLSFAASMEQIERGVSSLERFVTGLS